MHNYIEHRNATASTWNEKKEKHKNFISRQHNGQDVCDIYHVVSGSGIILPTSSETRYSWQWTCCVDWSYESWKKFRRNFRDFGILSQREQVSNSNWHSPLYPCSVCGKWRHNHPAYISMLTLTGTARIYAHTHVSKTETFWGSCGITSRDSKKNIPFIHCMARTFGASSSSMHYDLINGDDFVRFHHHKYAHKF